MTVRPVTEVPAATPRLVLALYTAPRPEASGGPLLYFAYTARIAPDRMAEASPGAEFEFVAHLPEWRLDFPIDGNGWGGALPNAMPAAGSTVWGVVYTVPDDELDAIDAVEREEGRSRSSVTAIDRTGRRHTVTTHVADAPNSASADPSVRYVTIMLTGCRHWSLPAGWIAGLEDHIGLGP